jgi:hypothetical protein
MQKTISTTSGKTQDTRTPPGPAQSSRRPPRLARRGRDRGRSIGLRFEPNRILLATDRESSVRGRREGEAVAAESEAAAAGLDCPRSSPSPPSLAPTSTNHLQCRTRQKSFSFLSGRLLVSPTWPLLCSASIKRRFGNWRRQARPSGWMDLWSGERGVLHVKLQLGCPR